MWYRGRVLPRNWISKKHVSCCQTIGEAEILLEAEVAPVVVMYNSALSPFPKLLEMQHNEKRKISLQELKKGFASSAKMDFMNIRNESKLRVIWVENFTENIYWSYGFWHVGLSDTKHVYRDAQSCIGTSSPALRHWCGKFATSVFANAKVWRRSLAFNTQLASGLMPGMPKVHMYSTV
jgi:hypothetical protein